MRESNISASYRLILLLTLPRTRLEQGGVAVFSRIMAVVLAVILVLTIGFSAIGAVVMRQEQIGRAHV